MTLSEFRQITDGDTGHSIDDTCGQADHWRVWKVLVQEYSKRTLTYPEDVLDAFASFISIFKERLSCCFFSGIMLDMLAEDVLFLFRGLASRRDLYFPSW
jgi:hypothetical protein